MLQAGSNTSADGAAADQQIGLQATRCPKLRGGDESFIAPHPLPNHNKKRVGARGPISESQPLRHRTGKSGRWAVRAAGNTEPPCLPEGLLLQEKKKDLILKFAQAGEGLSCTSVLPEE